MKDGIMGRVADASSKIKRNFGVGGKTVPDMHGAILAYLLANEPEGAYDFSP